MFVHALAVGRMRRVSKKRIFNIIVDEGEKEMAGGIDRSVNEGQTKSES